MSKKTIVALLPLKANSERVKGKNFRSMAGKPLFSWVLDELLKIKEIDKVVINTDARTILEEHGLFESDRVMFRTRREDLCGDLVSMNLILEDDINAVEADTYLMTHVTNPLLRAETIKRSIDGFHQKLSTDECDSAFSVTKFQTRFYREDGTAINHDPDNLIRTQDLEPWFEENSCLYLFTKSSFQSTSARIGNKPYLIEIPKLQAVDIDEPEDWLLAESLANAVNSGTMI